MVSRSLAADRLRTADRCPLNRQSGIKRACLSPPGEIPGGDAIYPDRRSGTSALAGVTKGRSMSTFDNPFDADRELKRSGCVCGRHGSAAEHDRVERSLRCEPVAPAESEAKRYE